MSVLDKILIGKLIEIEQPRFSRNLGGPGRGQKRRPTGQWNYKNYIGII
jgi:hypothetical protein